MTAPYILAGLLSLAFLVKLANLVWLATLADDYSDYGQRIRERQR